MAGGDRAGGSAGLVGLIDEVGAAALAVDLAAHGVDLWEWMADLCSSCPSRHPGWLLAMVEWLPDGGAVAAVLAHEGRAVAAADAEGGPREWWGWGRDRHLLADLWDLTAAAGAGKKRPPEYPRPRARAAARGLAGQLERIRRRRRRG